VMLSTISEVDFLISSSAASEADGNAVWMLA